MSVVNRPAMTDDTGNLTSGTVVDKTFMDAVLEEIDTQCHSAANPTVTPVNVIDLVVAAAGSKTDLDARLDVSLNEDGTLKTQASLVTLTQAANLPQSNVVVNETFLIWALGDALAATGWVLAGTGAAVARAGTGLGDTKRKVGDFCSKLTFGSSTLTYYHEFLPAAAYSRLDSLDAKVVGFGMWVWASAASQVRGYVYDGATTSYTTAYHTGGSTWEWLSGTHTISGSATLLRVGAQVESSAGNPAYVSGVTAIFGSIAPADWRPTPVAYGTIVHKVSGNAAVDTQVDTFMFQRMGIVKDVQVYCETAPTDASLIVDVNGGAAGANSMFSTLPTVLTTAQVGGAIPDGTYQYRCFQGNPGGTTLTSSILTSEITQVGSTLTGADIVIMIRVMVYVSPFESALAA